MTWKLERGLISNNWGENQMVMVHLPLSNIFGKTNFGTYQGYALAYNCFEGYLEKILMPSFDYTNSQKFEANSIKCNILHQKY